MVYWYIDGSTRAITLVIEDEHGKSHRETLNQTEALAFVEELSDDLGYWDETDRSTKPQADNAGIESHPDAPKKPGARG